MNEYEYTFQVWPDEQRGWDPAVFELFKLYGRVGMEFTPPAFREFEEKLARAGLTIRECERRAVGPVETVR